MPVNPLLPEELLHFIWQHRLFRQQALFTTSGDPVRILCPGIYNHHDGPDFSHASIFIGITRWVGNVELHIRSSDWYRHLHHHNPKYANIILHVVFLDDKENQPFPAPCLELQQHVSKLMLRHYTALKNNAAFIPCAGLASRVPALHWMAWEERLLADRWELKMEPWQQWLLQSRFNWDEVCYLVLAEAFGLPQNTTAMLQLAQSVPWKLLLRYRHDLVLTEALLFGQAGMLACDDPDAYTQELQRHYTWLAHKHQLTPIPGSVWKWLRIRPSSFPAMRIAQLATLLHQYPRLFSTLLDMNTLSGLQAIFFVEPSPYWQTHYRLGGSEQAATATIGKQGVNNIIINAVLPLLFFYGKVCNSWYRRQLALEWLLQLPAEDNKVMKEWKKIGIYPHNALESQGLLHLKKYYCNEKKCLQCAVGTRLMMKEGIAV